MYSMIDWTCIFWEDASSQDKAQVVPVVLSHLARLDFRVNAMRYTHNMSEAKKYLRLPLCHFL